MLKFDNNLKYKTLRDHLEAIVISLYQYCGVILKAKKNYLLNFIEKFKIKI